MKEIWLNSSSKGCNYNFNDHSQANFYDESNDNYCESNQDELSDSRYSDYIELSLIDILGG